MLTFVPFVSIRFEKSPVADGDDADDKDAVFVLMMTVLMRMITLLLLRLAMTLLCVQSISSQERVGSRGCARVYV